MSIIGFLKFQRVRTFPEFKRRLLSDEHATRMRLAASGHFCRLPSALLHRSVHRHSVHCLVERLEGGEKTLWTRDERRDPNCQIQRLRIQNSSCKLVLCDERDRLVCIGSTSSVSNSIFLYKGNHYNLWRVTIVLLLAALVS